MQKVLWRIIIVAGWMVVGFPFVMPAQKDGATKILPPLHHRQAGCAAG